MMTVEEEAAATDGENSPGRGPHVVLECLRVEIGMVCRTSASVGCPQEGLGREMARLEVERQEWAGRKVRFETRSGCGYMWKLE